MFSMRLMENIDDKLIINNNENQQISNLFIKYNYTVYK